MRGSSSTTRRRRGSVGLTASPGRSSAHKPAGPAADLTGSVADLDDGLDDGSGGFALIESDDAKALTEFALAWHDLMGLEMVPVVDDSDLSEVFQRVVKP